MSCIAVVLLVLGGTSSIGAEEAVVEAEAPAAPAAGKVAKPQAAPAPMIKLPAVENAKRLDPKSEVWVDKERGVVIVDGAVSFRRGFWKCSPVRGGRRSTNRWWRSTPRRSSCMWG
jgi:hypothetical protein